MKSLLRSLLAIALSFSFLIDFPAAAQSAPSRIEVVIVEGAGVVNRPGQRVRRLAVRVEDDDHRPVAGASVVFALPVSGPSGEFSDGVRNYTAITNYEGLAIATGMRLNQIPGKLQIYVTASYRGLRSNGLIEQQIEGVARTEPPAKTGHKWRWITLGVLMAAGAAGGAYYYTQVRTTTATSSPISITTGSVVFGGPR